MNLWTIFLTGLITGGLTCMAVQGGLLAATIAQREEDRLKEYATKGNAFPILAFLVAKLVAYTLLGFLLGWLGSAFTLSLEARTIMQFAVAVFMIGTALNILEIHPIFRYFVIQPPHFLTRLIRKQSKSKEVFAPALLGAFTVFIPCGTTQAMMALSIASSNPISGAAILFAFVLGTSPIFFVLGYFATKLGDTFQKKFMYVAAIAIIVLALFNINTALALSGSDFTVQNILSSINCDISFCSTSSRLNAQTIGQQIETNPTITINSTGYTPNAITIKAGSKITLHLKNTNGSGCIQGFTIPKLGIQKTVATGTSEDISFIAPGQPGKLPFMCSMGMYPGVFNVI